MKGRAAVIPGAGSNDTKKAQALHKKMHDLKRFDAATARDALVQQAHASEGLYRHFRAVAESGAALPVVLYNVPGRTGVNLDVKTVARLSEIRHIVGVKEASANVVQMCEIYAACREDFLLLSGDDPLTVAVMAIGGRGVISVASNAMPGGDGPDRRAL